ncbi:hypothetical protein C731_3779 [Mycolicibacterium hassiacum DSM 44199]|jgi:hypothetical protein|uniref:Uncharacterized protein n=1 Tax=Mycolicibacterium hassiacum (strain DSM 44199 / CIP 105218 / JCM 12690 / 3849) TaxID=1122247 RepID=K5BDN9_MYCHD|nr:hypothetical protein C731_3779 [Mycolicibacterium hassiacum DSM 44199]MDA4087440.1 hypothetical protein [Mycolicibacterium hassiacum DSM 44199]VCT91935.1 hypothetical protein MHAS_03659 [Mycolicibacterium hassiacum DSM 44199]
MDIDAIVAAGGLIGLAIAAITGAVWDSPLARPPRSRRSPSRRA